MEEARYLPFTNLTVWQKENLESNDSYNFQKYITYVHDMYIYYVHELLSYILKKQRGIICTLVRIVRFKLNNAAP